jgi:hypothetical protein
MPRIAEHECEPGKGELVVYQTGGSNYGGSNYDQPVWDLLGGGTQDGDNAWVQIVYCPFCGAKLPDPPEEK